MISRPRAEVFAFFAGAANLAGITPPFLRFYILKPAPPVAAGALIDYRLHLFGVPLRWRTRIETFEPERSFTDVQLHGPYRRWHHLHASADVPEGTEMRDVVDYEFAFSLLGVMAHVLFVRRTLECILDYRRVVVAQLLG